MALGRYNESVVAIDPSNGRILSIDDQARDCHGASRTRLPVKVLKCAWFDEKDYFEFFPLQAIKANSAQASA
jgi:hypothetical protein